jgi:nitrogen regulatory protein P-II 1
MGGTGGHHFSRAGVAMTRIEAIIQPSRLDQVKEALAGWGITGLTVTEVEGHARQRGHAETYRGAEYAIELVPKLKVEVVVPTPLVPRLADVILRAARTGRIGDGKLFFTTVEQAVRVRTGERGEDAL